MNDKYYVNTFNCEMILDRILFSSTDMNLLLEYLLDRDEINLLQPPDENIFGTGLYGNVVVSDGLIFLIPFYAENIWKLYDKSRWEKIAFSGSENRGKFLGAVPAGKYIYLLGYGRKEIYKLNTVTDQIKELRIDVKSEIPEPDDAGFLGFDYEMVGGRIFVPLLCANKVLEIDPDTDFINVLDVPGRSNGYSGIVYDGNGFWLAPRRGRYFAHYLFNGRVEEYELPLEYKKDEMYFGGAYREGNHIIFTAFYGKNFKFDPESPKDCETFGPSIYYCKALHNKGKVIQERNGQTYYVDPEGNIRKLNLSISNADRLGYIGKHAGGKTIFAEGRDLSLNEYLKVVEHCHN